MTTKQKSCAPTGQETICENLTKISKMQMFVICILTQTQCIQHRKASVYFYLNNNNKLSRLTADDCKLPRQSLGAIA